MTQTPTLTADELLSGWSPRRIGRQILTVADCTSTNDLAFAPVQNGPSDGLVVFADHQTAGRGRLGRSWLSPRAASILCSLVLEESPHASAPAGPQLTLLAAVAVCEAIQRASDVTPSIRWPNDLRVGGRKLAGILIESRMLQHRRIQAWVIGIGINCLQQPAHFPPELRDAVTSLNILCSEPIDRVAVGRALLQRLDEWVHSLALPDAGAALHDRWLHFAEPLGGYIRLLSGGREYSGRIICVDPTGGLIVQTDDGGRRWFDPMLTSPVENRRSIV